MHTHRYGYNHRCKLFCLLILILNSKELYDVYTKFNISISFMKKEVIQIQEQINLFVLIFLVQLTLFLDFIIFPQFCNFFPKKRSFL